MFGFVYSSPYSNSGDCGLWSLVAAETKVVFCSYVEDVVPLAPSVAYHVFSQLCYYLALLFALTVVLPK